MSFNANPSVVVIGAGALGLCTAYHLMDLGVTQVTLVERAYPASASSGLSVGIVETQYLGLLAAEWIVHGEPRTIPAARALAPRPAVAT